MRTNHVLKLLTLIYFAAWLSGCDTYDAQNPDTANQEGIWIIDNGSTRRADEEPVLKMVSIHATHMEFSPGQGTVGTEGHWRDDAFWCAARDGSGEYAAAKVLPDDQLELHLEAFYPNNKEVLTLYKKEGSDAEKQMIAKKYPLPLEYPPPKGTFTAGMTEYQLQSLPWKPTISTLMNQDDINKERDEAYLNGGASSQVIRVVGVLYTYHSDNPNLTDLKVTVKDHHVSEVSGGNE
jgi:hypothetical protein